jgi:glucose uptake protein GlcU
MKKKIIIGLVAVAVLVSGFLFFNITERQISQRSSSLLVRENSLWISQPPVSWKQKIL